MPAAWDRPAISLIPNRQGDLESDQIFLALGKAVSAWEGVGAAISSVFFAMLSEQERNQMAGLELAQFGDLNNIHARVKQMRDLWSQFSSGDFGARKPDVEAVSVEIESIAPIVRGWAERRNDLAHGYVTEASSPDYFKPDQPILTNYALCPSHARSSKWPHAEPTYNYVSLDIVRFTEAFEKLDREIETIAKRIELLRDMRS